MQDAEKSSTQSAQETAKNHKTYYEIPHDQLSRLKQLQEMQERKDDS